jgi:hypothetical protein
VAQESGTASLAARDRRIAKVEWAVLLMVVLATIGLGLQTESASSPELEVTHISGTIILSTRASMDALGLEEFNREALATVDMESHSVISTECTYCQSSPIGIHLNGSVLITDLISDVLPDTRVEGELSITHLMEYQKGDLILREWLSIDWDAGATSANLELFITHNPPRWNPSNRHSASFTTIDGNEVSKTGPWILIEELLDNARNTRGCLPDNFFCNENTRPDINLTSTFNQASEPISIQQPAEWVPIGGSPSTNQTPSKMADIRQMFELGEELNDSTPMCPPSEEEVVASHSWNVVDSSSTAVAPLSIWFDALGLQYSIFTPQGAIWNEVDYANHGCATLVDETGQISLGIYLY